LAFEKELEHGIAWVLLENWLQIGEANGLAENAFSTRMKPQSSASASIYIPFLTSIYRDQPHSSALTLNA
jgi:hypothetical protein